MQRHGSASQGALEPLQKRCSRDASATPYRWRSRERRRLRPSIFPHMLIKDQASMIQKHANGFDEVDEAAAEAKITGRSPSRIIGLTHTSNSPAEDRPLCTS